MASAGRLGDADWLDGVFSAGDLMMVSVLLRLKPSGLLDEYPNLSAYVAWPCPSRPRVCSSAGGPITGSRLSIFRRRNDLAA